MRRRRRVKESLRLRMGTPHTLPSGHQPPRSVQPAMGKPCRRRGPTHPCCSPGELPPQELLDAAEAPQGPVPARPAPFRRALASLHRPSRLRRAHSEHASAAEPGHTGALPCEAVADSLLGSLPASLVPDDTSSPNPSIYRAAREPSRVGAEEHAPPPGKSTPAFMRAMHALTPPLPAGQPQPAALEHAEVSGAFGSPIFRTVPGPDDTAAGPGACGSQQGPSQIVTAQGAACLHKQHSLYVTSSQVCPCLCWVYLRRPASV